MTGDHMGWRRRFAAPVTVGQRTDRGAAMQQRTFGRTGMTVSALGFGCGAVGGLRGKGAPADQERAVARAVAAGITFFDTAPGYGDGRSETNLGRVLARLRPTVTVATKVMLRGDDRADIAAAVPRSLDASLRRLGRDHVDLVQLHNAIVEAPHGEGLTTDVVLGEVVEAMQALRAAGRTRFIGITGVGDTAAVLRVVDSGAFDSSQVAYSLLNPSPAYTLPTGFPGHDFGRLIARAAAAGMGTIGIRALAGGALSGTTERHPIGTDAVGPIGTGATYASDVDAGRRFEALLADADAADLVELALRFAIADGGPTTVLVGTSTLEQLDHAIAAVEKGPLSSSALSGVQQIWQDLAASSGG
jgi:aryl-alcohol dehydrogenase-like predicted oxidoreductase